MGLRDNGRRGMLGFMTSSLSSATEKNCLGLTAAFYFAFTLFPAAHGADFTWLGTEKGAQGPNYSNVNNWSPAAENPPGANDRAFFDDNAILTLNIFGGTNRFVGAFYFEATKEYSFLLSRDDRHYDLSAGIRQNGSGNVLFTASLQFGNNATISGTGSGNLVFDRFLRGNGLVLESTGSFRVYVNGAQEGTVGGGNYLNTAQSVIGGSGSLSRMLSVEAAGATIAAGAHNTAGTFTLGGGLSALVATRFEFDLGGTGGAHDRLAITGGTFRLGNPGEGGYEIILNDLGQAAVAAQTPIVLIEAGSEAVLDMSAFNPDAFSVAPLPSGWVLDAAYGQNGVLFDPGSGQLSIQFSAIPEPSTAFLFTTMGAAVGLVLRRQRGPRKI